MGNSIKKEYNRLSITKDIAEQDYNLSVSSYIEQEDTREEIDIAKLNNCFTKPRLNTGG